MCVGAGSRAERVAGEQRLSEPKDSAALPDDRCRLEMMRQTASLPLERRIALFEALSRDAAWARGAVRIR